MEVEAAQKRNTDCVYFLASPLTCKKGSDCEYRHSDSARLNPRDCWYWLNGTCLNPSCPFRHPPLEGLSETVPEQALQPTHAAPTHASKANVPCYFFFNAYCMNGDQCPFLHETFPAQKLPKPAPETTTAHHLPEIKASSGSDTGPASIEVLANPPEATSELAKEEHPKEEQSKEVHPKEHPKEEQPKEVHPEEVTQRQTTTTPLEGRSSSLVSSPPDFEEPSIKLSEENPLPPAEYSNGSPRICADQGSDEIAKECAEADEWWESSPGFDVLVDDGLEQLAYEEDAEYLLTREREPEMLLQYDYEVPRGYDPLTYPDAGFLFEQGVYDHYDHPERRDTPEHLHKASEPSSERRNSEWARHRERELTSHRRRKPSQRRREFLEKRDAMDLRDHLRKRRRSDGSPCKRYPSESRGSSQERPGRHVVVPLLQGRLVRSEDASYMHGFPRNDTESALNSFRGRGWSGHPKSTRHVQSRLKERETRRSRRKPQPTYSSEISRASERRKVESWRTRSVDTTFSGPKTLAEIKEEKRRAREAKSNGPEANAFRSSRQPGSKDFNGPKPLNQLLGDKRSYGNRDGSADMSSGNEIEHREISRKQKSGSESGFVDDEGDSYGDEDKDEDALEERLVNILSS